MFYQAEKRAPMRFGKRHSDKNLEDNEYEVEKRAPMRFGKRHSDENLEEDEYEA